MRTIRILELHKAIKLSRTEGRSDKSLTGNALVRLISCFYRLGDKLPSTRMYSERTSRTLLPLKVENIQNFSKL